MHRFSFVDVRGCSNWSMVLTYVSSCNFGFELLKTFVGLDLRSLCVFHVVYTQF